MIMMCCRTDDIQKREFNAKIFTEAHLGLSKNIFEFDITNS